MAGLEQVISLTGGLARKRRGGGVFDGGREKQINKKVSIKIQT